MNPIELHLPNGQPARVYACSQCKRIQGNESEAQKCCSQTICICGSVIDQKYHLLCTRCELLKSAADELDRFRQAHKIQASDYQDWVYRDGAGNNGFAESPEEWLESWRDLHGDEEPPKYVWACRKNHFAFTDIETITEPIEDRGYEDFEARDLNGIPELEAAIKAFNDANRDLVSYEPDYTRVILLT